jgi:hypothetical protein
MNERVPAESVVSSDNVQEDVQVQESLHDLSFRWNGQLFSLQINAADLGWPPFALSLLPL